MGIKYMVLWMASLSGLMAGTLSLDEAIGQTLRTHPDMQMAEMRHESAQIDSRSAQSALSPRLDANIGYYPTKTFVMPANGTFSTRESDAFHADITGSYSLWDAGRLRERYSASLRNEESEASMQRVSQNILIEQVWLRYYTLAYLDALIDTAEHSVRFYNAQYTQALNMRASGLKTEADASRFKASLMLSQDALSAARTEMEKTRLALELLMGSDEAVVLDKEALTGRADTITIPPLETLRQELITQNPKLQALRASIVSKKSLSEASLHERYGSIALVGSYGVDNSLSTYDSSLIGVIGTIPLYDGGKLSSEAQKSRISYSLAQKEYESSERLLWQELYGAYHDFKRSDASIAVQMSVITATNTSLSLMEGRYQQGLATYVDVLESQSVLENARIALAAAKFQKIRAFAQIQRLLNKGCENDICKK